MKLAIEIDSDGTREVYTSLDLLTGGVCLDVKHSFPITRLEVIIEASILSYSPVDPFDYGYALLPTHHKAFSTSLVLFPTFPLRTSTRYTIGKGRHEFKFGMDLCLLSHCMEVAIKASSILARAYRRTGRIVYFIQAVSQACGRFGRHLSPKIELISMRMEGPQITICSTPGMRRIIQFLPGAVLGIDSPSETQARSDQLPPYSPAVILGAKVTAGSSPQGNDCVALELYLTVPSTLAGSMKASLKSIRLSFITIKDSKKPCKQGLVLTTTTIQQIRLDIPLLTSTNEEHVCIDSTLWHHDIRIPQEIPQVGGESQSLQVLYEFLPSKLVTSKFATLLIPITVSATNSIPAPRYEARNCEQC